MKYLSPIYRLEGIPRGFVIKNRFTGLIKYRVNSKSTLGEEDISKLRILDDQYFHNTCFSSISKVYMEEVEYMAYSRRINLYLKKVPDMTYQYFQLVERLIAEAKLEFYFENNLEDNLEDNLYILQNLLHTFPRNKDNRYYLNVIVGSAEFVEARMIEKKGEWVFPITLSEYVTKLGPITKHDLYGYKPKGKYLISDYYKKNYRILLKPLGMHEILELLQQEIMFYFLDIASNYKYGFSNIWATQIIGDRLSKEIYSIPYRKGGDSVLMGIEVNGRKEK